MIQQRLKNYRKNRNCTLLGVGPMSKNCIDATIELANEYCTPLMLIASRRQIDSEQFGGGYVENWTTEQFADYVRYKDTQKNIILARDHGGPWQNELEISNKLNLNDAMQSAKESYRADIDAGFQMLHIDPSVDIHANPNIDQVLERVYELYEFCWTYSQQKKQDVIFEIGTEEQNGSNNTQEELEYTLECMSKFCKSNKLPYPSFIVIQAGTRVMEMRNVGSFDSPIRVANELPPEIQIPRMISICNHYKIFMKEHNADYLSTDSLTNCGSTCGSLPAVTSGCNRTVKSLVTLSNTVYALSDIYSDSCTRTTHLDKFDPSSNSWAYLSSSPSTKYDSAKGHGLVWTV